uniref:Titin n=1 Tax=Varanus komodoensis TaxID=61221 RepID=A0A8D2JGT9_VARKO
WGNHMIMSLCSFFISVPPSVELDVKLIEGLVVKAGSTVRFPAIMRGVPVPTPKWATDGTEIKSEGNYKIDTDNYSTVLTIKSCTRKDTGEYLLTVSNIAGSKTVPVHLTVLDVPGPPTGPIDILEVTPDHMVISWRPPKDDGGSPVINYIVEKRESKKETWGVVSSGVNQTRMKIPLKAATRADHGKYLISAKNSSGHAQASAIVNVLDRPGPCRNLKVSYVTKDSCMVSWENPEDNGGSEITNYIVEYRKPNQRGWSIVSSDLTKRLVKAHLTENQEYFFRVCAENKVGPGPVVETKTPILAINPIDRPGEPENLHIAETGKTFAYLKWRRPDYDGGSPNLTYHVERKLKDSDEVQTKNEAGESNWVKTSEVVVKEEVQKPVLELKLAGVLTVKAGEPIKIEAGLRGKPQPEVSWTKDAEDLSKSPRAKIETTSTFSKFLLSKSRRTDGGKYVITATNPAGSFVAYATVNVLDKPGPVQNLKTSDVSSDRCTITWDPPEDDGGCEIQNYIVEKCESKRMVWTTCSSSVIMTSIHVTHLIEGNEYIFRVRAENKMGTGPPTETKPIVAKTKYNRPGRPDPPEVTRVSKDEMTVVWNPPEYDGGKSITGYILEKKEKRGLRWVPVTKTPIPERRKKVQDLIPGYEYQFRVKAENEIGVGEPSFPSRPAIARDPIGTDLPYIFVLLIVSFITISSDSLECLLLTKTSITLGWGKPLYDGGAPIIGYVVEMRPKTEKAGPDEGWKRCNVAAQVIHTEFTVTSLDEKELYEFRVSAQNQVGIGRPAELKEAVSPKEILGNFAYQPLHTIYLLS